MADEIKIGGYTKKEFGSARLCGNCANWNSADINIYGEATCPKRFSGSKITFSDRAVCGKYDPIRRDNEINNRFDQILRKMNSSKTSTVNDIGGCFITTVIVNILGMADDCIEIETLRNFRNDVMQKDEAYLSLLAQYDIVGPKIAVAIFESEKSKEIASAAFVKFIVPVSNYIQNGDFALATELYTQMVKYYQNAFGIEDVLLEDEVLEYEKTTEANQMGHGYQRVRKEKKKKTKESL